MNKKYSGLRKIVKFINDDQEEIIQQVIEETAVSLMVNGEEWLTLRCSPTDLEELGIGFLYNQGIIQDISEIEDIKICERNVLDIWLNHSAEKPNLIERTSGCTGGASYYVEELKPAQVKTKTTFSQDQIFVLLEKFFKAQEEIRKEVRGLHSSALSDGKNIDFIFSDIGRHNTLDKLAGKWLKTIPHPPVCILLCTGRISSEMLFKCANLSSEIIVSLSTPTLQAVEDAEKLGITLIGYARANQFSIYSNPQRIRGLKNS